MPVSYEWCIEYTDQFGDIYDHYWGTDLKQVSPRLNDREDSGYLGIIVLVRITGNQEDGETSRGYAYLEGSRLPVQFDNGQMVPKVFHNEVVSFDDFCMGKWQSL